MRLLDGWLRAGSHQLNNPNVVAGAMLRWKSGIGAPPPLLELNRQDLREDCCMVYGPAA